MKKLSDKVAIITGAGSGIGKAIALRFAAEGCAIIAGDIHKERLQQLEQEIRGEGGRITTMVADLAVEADIDRLVDSAVAEYGTLDILVNNAGIMDHFAPVGEVDNAMWEKVNKVNVEGPFKAMRRAVHLFLPKGKGVIINIASVGGLMGGRAGAAYTASKHALIGLTKNTGYMYSKSGIRCNAIAPGAVTTNIGDTIDFSKITPLVNERIMSGLVLNPRSGEADEIAAAALFLASDEASFVNATVLTVDGGWTGF